MTASAPVPSSPVQAALDGLAGDLGALDGVRHAQVWEGSWDELESSKRLSFKAPAVLVSLVEFGVVHLAQTVRGRRRLAADEAPPHTVPAAGARTVPFQPDGMVRATVDAEIAVTCVADDPRAADRAAAALDLATRAVPVLVAHALRDVAGSNLDSSKLRDRGQSAFVLVGRREICLDPAGGDRQELTRIDLVDGAGVRSTVPGVPPTG